MKRIGGTRPLVKTLASESGLYWIGWPKVTQGGSGSWTVATPPQMDREQLSWRNGSAGAGKGLASFRTGLSFPTEGGYTNAHTVHVRCDRGDQAAEVLQVGPATAINQSVAGNGYAVRVVAGGSLALLKLSTWTPTVLGTASVAVAAGDVISLSYRSSVGAELAVLHNGILVLTVVDGAGLAMGRPGVLGDDSLTVPTSRVVGHTVTEWWVTGGWQTFELLPARPSLISALRVAVLGRRPWLNSAEPIIRRLVSGEILDARWTWKRLGGCGALDITFRYPDVGSDEHDDAKTWSDPEVDDWETSHWLGGEVVLDLHHRDVDVTKSQRTDAVWRGRITTIDAEPSTRTITLQAEGLVAVLDEVYVSKTYTNETLREVLRDLAIQASQVSDPGYGGGGTYVRYNPLKIIGLQSTLDQRATFEFEHVPVQSALQQVVAFLPDGFTWGVDGDGDFYLDQQVDHYATDLGGGAMQHFDAASQQVLEFTLSQDLSRIVTTYMVLGEELPNHELGAVSRPSSIRVAGLATSTRARQLFGGRGRVEVNGDLRSDGMCTRVAAASIRGMLVPSISAQLTVADGVQDARDVQHLIERAPPRVSVADRQRSYVLPGGGTSSRVSTEYTLRRWGDYPSFRTNDKGSAGAYVELASTAAERAINRSWLFHVTLRFDYAMPAGVNDIFVGGRDTGADNGWGFLYWERSSGKLIWCYTSAAALTRVVDTGITVSSIGTVVHFSVWRDAAGTFRFYNGNSLTRTESGLQPDVLPNNTAKWRFFAETGATNYNAWDGAFEQVWLITTDNEEVNNSGGVVGFIAASNEKPLARNRAHGLRLYLPANEPMSNPTFPIPLAGTVSLPAWQGGVAVQAVWSPSLAGGTGDGAAVVTAARRGVLIGMPKRWGGPLVLDVESCEYSIDVSSGQLRRSFSLGEIPSSATSTLAKLGEDVRRLNEDRVSASDAGGSLSPSSIERQNGGGPTAAPSGPHTHDPADIVFVAADRIAASTGAGGATEEWPFYTVGQNIAAATSQAMARAALALGTAAVVDTGTGAANVPTTAQADTLYDPIGIAAALVAALSSSLGSLAYLATVGTAQIDLAAVTLDRIQNIASERLLGRPLLAGSGVASEISLGASLEFFGSTVQRAALTGDVTAAANSNVLAIAANVVGSVELADFSAASRLLGRGSAAGAGDPQEITLGATLSMSGTALAVVDASTTAKGAVELATDGENAAGVAVQGNDARVNKSMRALAQTLDSAEVASSAAEITLCDLTVPANAMGATGGGWVRVSMFVYNGTGSNQSSTVKVYWGGTAYWGDVYGAHPSDSTYHAVVIQVWVDNLGVTNKQHVSGFISGSVNTGASTGEGNWGTTSPSNPFSNAEGGAPTKDTTAAQNIKVTWQMGTSSANLRIRNVVARLTLVPGA